jgi:hypothetical protein
MYREMMQAGTAHVEEAEYLHVAGITGDRTVKKTVSEP